ncbi:metallophosphoesterase [uncultured Parabacteroides sp.]|uniref:metallophosphoesterase family protein n=1 Tax=uncultured Parabacteroides sp. TaxID=512312 RepID=UPI002618B525|nr:metallophosphoesterase [uncultured Parabacteroides sp.]
MEKKTLYLIYAIIALSSAIACKDTEDNLSVSTLRSDINDYFYTINNNEATRRLDSIMYNKIDTDNIYERFKIVHISDPHISAVSTNNNYTNPINLKQSVTFANQSKLKINTLIATGDFISNSSRKEAILFMESFTKNFYEGNHIPSFICTGNHDCNMIEKVSKHYINKEQIHSILFRKQTQTDQNYFYSDIPNPQGGTIRIISLDMLDQPAAEYNTLFYAYFSQEQINWLGNIALKEGVTDQHSIIILTHYPFQAYSSNAKTYLCDGDFIHPWFMIPEIIEAYRSRSSISKIYSNKLNNDNNISANFNFYNSKGEFICYLGGHDHFTTNFDIQNFENENKNISPQKMLLCTNQGPSEIGVVYNRVTREADSPSSNSFCIYAIDTKEKNIYITFFGAYKPTDQTEYPEIQIIPY